MVKNIVFDMGGVIIDFNFDKTLGEYFPEKYRTMLKERIFENEIWRKMDAGLERSSNVIENIVPQLPEEIRELTSSMVSDFYPHMPIIDGTEDLIKRLKAAGYSVYLLSNATARFFDKYLDIPALTLMDGYFISALYKLVKPQREIYEAFCNKFSLTPEECFFIDDTAKNIEAAKEYGMHGFVFKKDIAALEDALRTDGVDF